MLSRRRWFGLAAAGAASIPSRAAASAPPLRSEAWTVGEQRDVDSLRRAVVNLAPPNPGEAIVEVRVAGLNHRDLLIARSRYGGPKPPSRIPLSDGAGVVVALGPASSEAAAAPAESAIRIGDRVTAAHFSRWFDGPFVPAVFAHDLGNTADGWLARHVRLPAAALVRIPAGLDDRAAAALGAAGITAWSVIAALGAAKPGDLVLTLGTGGVSVLALQIAKLFGARVAITSSSDAKLEIARRLGAEIAINYRSEPDWSKRVLEASGGRGADIVVETVGTGTLDQSAAACAANGRIGLLGGLAAPPEGQAARPWGALIQKNLTIKGITSGSRAQLVELLQAAAANRLQPHVDRVFPFEAAREAYRHLDAAEHVGKVLVEVG